MLDDIGADEYKIEENNRNYTLRIGSTNHKIHLSLSTNDYGQLKNYAGELTLNDLRQINRVFLLTPTIFDAKEEFKKAIERKKIGIAEKDDYVHTIFYMMIGTDISTLSIAIPRDETPRIIRLEQRSNMLKLGRDSLIDRLGYLEREAEEIKRDLDEIQNGNINLQSIADAIGQGIPNIPIRTAQPEYSSNTQRKGIVKPPDEEYSSNTQRKGIVQPPPGPEYSSHVQRPQPPLPDSFGAEYSSAVEQSKAKVPDLARPDSFGAEYSSAVEQGKDKSQYKPLPDSFGEEYGSASKKEPKQESFGEEYGSAGIGEIVPSGNQGAKFPSGILNNIIKNEAEIDFVLKQIDSKFPGSTYRLLYKGTSDGDSASTFHSKCDNAEKTLTIVEDTVGNRFGGFTAKDWSGTKVSKKDEDAFIFSIGKRKIYENIPDKPAIECFPLSGPAFSGLQIRLFDKFFTQGGTTFKKGYNYYTDEDYELTGGNKSYSVRDVEVYEVS